MKKLPEIVQSAWMNREGPAVLATVDADGKPNVIYVGSVNAWGDDTVLVADNYMHKTCANILAGSPGALLFLTKDRKAYQFKGAITYHTEGPLFESMKTWNKPEYPGVAAVALQVREIYSGAEKLR